MDAGLRQNIELAGIFEEIADLLEIKGENPFKIRAYRRGAQAIALLPIPVSEAVESRAIDAVDGIGKALSAKIEEWLATGEVRYHRELVREIPPTLIPVMRLAGIGPKMAKRLHDEIGVASLEDLARAVADKSLSRVKGVGPRAQATIERALATLTDAAGRLPLGEALAIGGQVLEYLQKSIHVTYAALAGSIRRRCDTVGDIDIVAASDDPGQVMDYFTSMPQIQEVLVKGDTKTSVALRHGTQVDLRVVSGPHFVSALHHFTGSKEHHVALRALAKKRGYSISEYGFTQIETGRSILPKSEEELYRLLGLDFVPPELREGQGEIEQALSGALPRLIEPDDIRGDLHVHSHWSDGRSTLIDMVREAKALGREYIAICDHSKALRIANGLTADDLKRQADEIRKVERQVGGIRVLRGVEVDILADGSLDLDDETLESLDIVVASIHSGMRQDAETLTNRLVRAIENPHVDIIGHPTGRILGRRDPYDVDIDRVIAAALEHGTALEINASPARLDLKDTLAARAYDAGVNLAINTDAHDCSELGDMWFGVSVARRARIPKEAVVNAWTIEKLFAWLGR